MGEHDRRVEPRTVLVGLGMAVTPERLGEIEQRRRELERLTQSKPREDFSTVMGRRGQKPAPSPTPKEQKRQALPRKGPRLALAHPAQRDAYGREESDEASIVLKG